LLSGEPLLTDWVGKHPNLNLEEVSIDSLFNSQPCQDKTGEILREDVELLSSANAKEERVLRTLLVELLKYKVGQCTVHS